ncbi:MAG TPA: peptidoglycan editing factor PgeF [Gammaproteobacteria bacterium]|nr:peptidoglycan editing factor PgeF [Gammaproteobacteria bacterium]
MGRRDSPAWLRPRWPVPPWVRALSTLRRGGVSRPPFDSLNLADHVGDAPESVTANRARLRLAAELPAEPCWLVQEHGIHVVDAAEAGPGCRADGAYCARPGVVCAVLTADCLPVLLCEPRRRLVAALHCGWRGLAAGLLEATLDRLAPAGGQWLAWLGPAIGPGAFEVGMDVYEAFVTQDPGAAVAFAASTPGRWFGDLWALARRRLAARGVTRIYGGGRCTWHEADSFYSYRRDGITGRMATLIWMEGTPG